MRRAIAFVVLLAVVWSAKASAERGVVWSAKASAERGVVRWSAKASAERGVVRWSAKASAERELYAPARAQRPTDADRAAELVVRWQRIIYPQFEDARAYLAEEVSDMVNALLSQGAVRAVHDHADGPALKESDDAARRFAAAMLKAGTKQPGGSLILEPGAYEQALDAVCPLYPFCEH